MARLGFQGGIIEQSRSGTIKNGEYVIRFAQSNLECDD
ncbi:MAG: hypothetical protein ACI8W8_000249 [Rhodothermales bacterium]|jgi:hypothetical protein